MHFLRSPAGRGASRLMACVLSVLAGAALARMLHDEGPSRAHARYAAAAAPRPLPIGGEPERPPETPGSEQGVFETALGASLARGKVITGRTPHRLVLFTFDDGPDLRTTPKLLDTLDELGIRAVFFLNSGRLDPASERGRARARLARQIAVRGHMLGDHSVDHALWTALPSRSIEAQLEASRAIFVESFGERPWLFRPPGGSRSERTDAIVAAHGYTQVLWNLGAADHEIHTPEGLLAAWRRMIGGREQQGGGGGIVLLHDTHPWTVEAVPLIVEDLRRRNCRLLERGEELYDIVPDPSLFFAPRGDAGPDAEAPPARPDPAVLAERQERLRREAARYCDPTPERPRIEDPGGEALDAFHAALRRLEAGEQPLVRVTHLGDSGLDLDQLPHFLRERFQERFGDGGTGFVLAQRPTTDYLNRTVRLSVPTPWQICSLLERCDPDGHYGLGGVVATSAAGAQTRWRTAAASRVELWYGAQPGGGTVELRIDGRPRRIATDAPALEDRWLAVDVEPGPHEVAVRAAGNGPVRVYGAVLERDTGVVWDTISLTGAFTVRMLDQDAEHFARQLHHRRPDLVILHFGGNDLRRYLQGTMTPSRLEEETRVLLERVRAARPEASCLLTGIADHGKSGPMYVRSEHVEPLVEAQRAAARAAGCGFFDTYRAMGGRGSIRRWQRDGLAADDLAHLSREGRRVLADWLGDALLRGYDG